MDRLLGTLTRILLLCGLGVFIALAGSLRPIPAKAEPLPDPTEPERSQKTRQSGTQAQQRKEPSWKLSSIIHSPRRKLAVINGEIRRVGEDIAGARILAIQSDTVVIHYRGQRRILRLLSGESGLSRTGNE